MERFFHTDCASERRSEHVCDAVIRFILLFVGLRSFARISWTVFHPLGDLISRGDSRSVEQRPFAR